MSKRTWAINGERGSAVPWIVLIIVLVGLALAAYWVWHKHHRPMMASACASANLSLGMGTAEGTAGTIYKHAVVTNNGNKSCMLTGYPAAFLVNSSGMVLGSGAEANPLYAPAMVTLAAGGGKAHTVLGFPEAGNFNPGICSAAAAQLKLYLPGSTEFVQTAETDQSCPGFSATAFQAGA